MVTTQLSVTIDEVTRPTGCIFLQSIIHQQYSRTSCTYYYKKVKKMSISFVKPGEEECERCDFHDKHLEDIHKLDKHELSKPDENGKKK